MAQDHLGNPVTLTRPETLRGIEGFMTGFLAYETQIADVLPAADADEGCALAQAYAACLHLFGEDAGGPARARPYAERALAAAGAASERERMMARFAQAWAANEEPAALEIGEALLARFPRDLVMLKLLQYFYFNRGDMPSMLRVAQSVDARNADNPYMHGMIAFGFEQCHLLEEAEAAARRAIAIKRKEPWAHHALAHVFLTQGRVAEGVAFLEDMAETWTGLTSFMVTHNWWHLALFYLSQGRFDDALGAYDAHVWGVEKDYSQDQVGAVSLLARMEFAGLDVGARWQDPAAHIAALGIDTVQPFLSLQYLLALGRAGHPLADELMSAIRDRAATAPKDLRAAWAEVALPAAEGILAHGRGDPDTTVRRLGLALPRMIETGGSHAQRDLFEQIHLDALIRSGRLIQAQQVLEQRRRFDPDGVPLNRLLAAVYDRLDLAPQAAQARARANAPRAER